MKDDDNVPLSFVLTSLLGGTGSLLLGYAFFQSDVFDRTHFSFQILSSGFIGSITFATFRFRDSRSAVAVLFVLALINLVLTRSNNLAFLARDLLFVGGLGLSVYLFYRYFFKSMKKTPFGYPLVLASLCAVSNVIVTLLLMILHTTFHSSIPYILTNLSVGFLSGLGMGFGIELFEFMGTRISRQVE